MYSLLKYQYPEGTEVITRLMGEVIFWKGDGQDCQIFRSNKWINCFDAGTGNVDDYISTAVGCEAINVFESEEIIKRKVHFIEQYLKGIKVQYQLGQLDDSKQWHNFTEGAMQYINRSDLHFRLAPKYVVLNGITFKNLESLLNHINSNYDME